MKYILHNEFLSQKYLLQIQLYSFTLYLIIFVLIEAESGAIAGMRCYCSFYYNDIRLPLIVVIDVREHYVLSFLTRSVTRIV